MGSGLDDLASIHHQNAVGVHHRGQPMGNYQCGAPFGQAVEGRPDVPFGFGIQRAGGLVKKQDWRVLEHRTRNGDALTLTTRELEPAVPDDRVVPVGQCRDEIMSGSRLGGLDDVFIAGIRAAKSNVCRRSVVEQGDVLADQRNAVAQARHGDVAHVLTIHGNRPTRGVVETQQQVHDGGFARAAGADKRDGAPGLNVEGDVFKRRLPGLVGKGCIGERHSAALELQGFGVGGIEDFGFLVEQIKAALHRGEAFLQSRVQISEAADGLIGEDDGGQKPDEFTQGSGARDNAPAAIGQHGSHGDTAEGFKDGIRAGAALHGLHDQVVDVVEQRVGAFALVGFHSVGFDQANA